MRLSYLTLWVCYIFLFTCQVSVASPVDADKELSMLDAVIENRRAYFSSREHRLDSLRLTLFSRPVDSLELISDNEKLGDGYITFNCDSAMLYYTRGYVLAEKCGDDSMTNLLAMKLAATIPMAGFVTIANNYYNSVDTVGMSHNMLYQYYSSGRAMNYYFEILHETSASEAYKFVEKVVKCQWNMVKYSPDSTLLHQKALAEYFYLTKDYAKAEKILLEIHSSFEDNPYQYANISETLGLLARQRGDDQAQIYYFAQAARTQIQAGIREVYSLQLLAEILFAQDDIYRSYECMLVALENAINMRSMARMMQISPQLTLFTDARDQLQEWWSRVYTIIITVLCVAIIVIIVITFFMYHQIARMRILHDNLTEANKAKDVYISQFVILCSVYMDKLNQLNNLVNRKITAGQIDELSRLTKTGKLVEEQTRDFYDIFDEAFLHIYPNFVKDVNELLLPGEQFELKEAEKLNTDLRILACIRMGVEDSNRIAQILNYSINTIYSYRNRLRNRAKNRETFEADIMNL